MLHASCTYYSILPVRTTRRRFPPFFRSHSAKIQAHPASWELHYTILYYPILPTLECLAIFVLPGRDLCYYGTVQYCTNFFEHSVQQHGGFVIQSCGSGLSATPNTEHRKTLIPYPPVESRKICLLRLYSSVQMRWLFPSFDAILWHKIVWHTILWYLVLSGFSSGLFDGGSRLVFGLPRVIRARVSTGS